MFDSHAVHDLQAVSPVAMPPLGCPAHQSGDLSPPNPTSAQLTGEVVWVRGCLSCGELNLDSFWGSAFLAQCSSMGCRHCGGTRMAVCPIELPGGQRGAA